MHADVESAHSIPVGFKVLEVPRRRIDRGKKIDVNASRLSAVTSPPLHFWWDVNVDGDDRRLQARGEMERAFIKGADFASCDALAFRAEVYRITGAPQDTVGTAKDLAPPLRELLRNGPKDTDDVSDDRDEDEFAQVTGEKKPRAR